MPRLAAWRQRVCIFNREKQCQLLPRKFTGLPLRLGSVFVGLNRYMSIENCLPSVYSVLNSPYSDFKKKILQYPSPAHMLPLPGSLSLYVPAHLKNLPSDSLTVCYPPMILGFYISVDQTSNHIHLFF